jgi:hypothetical protein
MHAPARESTADVIMWNSKSDIQSSCCGSAILNPSKISTLAGEFNSSKAVTYENHGLSHPTSQVLALLEDPPYRKIQSNFKSRESDKLPTATFLLAKTSDNFPCLLIVFLCWMRQNCLPTPYS